jgi:3-oxoacyl-(acyl-carrier-protein) synthase
LHAHADVAPTNTTAPWSYQARPADVKPKERQVPIWKSRSGSSLKSLIGHPQGACGAAGVAATLLAMRDGLVPPAINVDEPDPECDLDYVPEIGRKLDIEYAVGNCIAFGSKNSALVLRNL